MELTNDFRVALPVEQAWAVLTDLERIAPCMPGAQLQEVEGDLHRGVVKIKVGPITAQYKGQAVFVDRDEATGVAVLRAEGRETRGQGHASATITATLEADGDGTAVSVVTDLTVTGRVAQFGRGVLADVSAKLLDQFVESLEQMVGADGSAVAGSSEPEAPPAETAPATKSPAKKSPAKKAAPPKAAAKQATAKQAAAKSEAPFTTAPGKDAPPTGETAPTPTTAVPSASSVPSAPAVRRIESPEPEPVNLLDAAGSPVAKRVGPVLAAVAILWLLKKLLGRRKR